MSGIVTEDHARIIAALARFDAHDSRSGKLLGDVAAEAGMGIERARSLLKDLCRRSSHANGPPLGGGREPMIYSTEPRARHPRRFYLRQGLEDLVQPGEQRRLGV
jgi:hypothetical protein